MYMYFVYTHSLINDLEDIILLFIHDIYRRCVTLSGTTIQEGKAIIKDALDQFENPTHIAVKCTAGKKCTCIS